MASSSGISSNSSENRCSASEKDLMDLRKRKRMISNRDSARRSRLRKQKHLEELVTQVAELRRQNNQILSELRATTQRHVAVESENSVLRAQAAELTHRLHSLNEIVSVMSCGNNGGAEALPPQASGFVGSSLNYLSQPIAMMAAAAALPADLGILY